MLFHKCGCLVVHGKCIFRKCFSVITCLWCKLISVFILPSNTIFRKTERERECESEIAPARKERERERERERPLPATHELRLRRRPRDFAPRTQIVVRLRHSTLTSNCTHWLRWRTQRPGSTFDFEFELHPLTSPANPEARIAVRPRVRIAPFDFAGEPRGQDHHSTSTSPAPIALSSRLRNSWVLMNLTGFDEFFLVGFWWI